MSWTRRLPGREATNRTVFFFATASLLKPFVVYTFPWQPVFHFYYGLFLVICLSAVHRSQLTGFPSISLGAFCIVSSYSNQEKSHDLHPPKQSKKVTRQSCAGSLMFFCFRSFATFRMLYKNHLNIMLGGSSPPTLSVPPPLVPDRPLSCPPLPVQIPFDLRDHTCVLLQSGSAKMSKPSNSTSTNMR